MVTMKIKTLESKTGSETSTPLGARLEMLPKSSVALPKPSALPVEATLAKKSVIDFGSSLELVLRLFPFILFAVAVLVAITR